MVADPAENIIDIGENRHDFTEWAIDLYRRDVDIDTVYDTFEDSADLVKFLLRECLKEKVCGEPELTAIFYATFTDIKPSTLRDYIDNMRISQEAIEEAKEMVPEKFGIVTATYYSIQPDSPEVEAALLDVLKVLYRSSENGIDGNEEEVNEAAEDFLELCYSVRNLAISKASSLLFFLHPMQFCVVNNRNKDAVEDFFDLNIGRSLDSFFEDVQTFRAVRDEFGFDEHFREFDWFCHWSQELSNVADWYKNNNIDDRSAWQVDIGQYKDTDPERVWDWWRNNDVCAIPPNIGDLAALEQPQIEERSIEADGPALEDLVRFRDELAEGDLVVAKRGTDVLGIGVVTGEYTHEPESTIPVEAPNWRSVQWLLNLELNPAGDLFDPDDAYDLDPDRIVGRIEEFERLRLDVDRVTGGSYTRDLIEMEDFISELNQQTIPPKGGGASSEPSHDGRQLFVQRGHDGPFRQNIGTTLATPISADVRAELQYLVEQAEVNSEEWERFDILLEEEQLTAWGAKDGYTGTVEEMEPGDLVLFIDGKDVAYCQQIDLVIRDPEESELRAELANLLRRDEDFGLLWFSKEPVLAFENPGSGDARDAIESVLREADPDFEYQDNWFPAQNQNLSKVSPEIISYFEGPTGLIESLTETDSVEYRGATSIPTSSSNVDPLLDKLGRSPLTDPPQFIVDVDCLRERDYPPVVHEFDDESEPENVDVGPNPRVKYLRVETADRPASDILMEADTRGLVLVRDGAEIVARGKLGCVFGKHEDTGGSSRTRIKVAPIVDYRRLRDGPRLPSDLQSTHDQLDARQDPIAPIDETTYENLIGKAIGLGLGETIPNLADSAGLQSEVYLVGAVHLVAGKNLAFYGPPGTGKTYASRRLAQDGAGVDLPVVTAHAELTNYDLVGGYAPGKSKQGGRNGIDWQPSAGSLTEAVQDCNTRLKNTGHHSWLLIDELNRANLDQAFGDVFTLLDIDYRDSQTLDFADEAVRMPYSFRLLATMNTSDRAKLFSLGYAFRRRFGFVPVSSLLTSVSDRPAYPDVDTPDQSVSNRTEVRQLVLNAVRGNLTRSRPMVAEPSAIVHPRDAATIDPYFSMPIRVEEAIEDISDASTFGYDTTDAIDATLEIGGYLAEHGIVEIGHTLAIDVVQFLAAAHFLTEGNLDRRWLDWAVATQVLPQLDEFLTDLREEETIGAVDVEGATKAEKFENAVDRLEAYGLLRSSQTLRTAREGYQLI